MVLNFAVDDADKALDDGCKPLPVDGLRDQTLAHVLVPEVVVVAGEPMQRVHFAPLFLPLLTRLDSSFSRTRQVVAVGEVEAQREVLLYFFQELLVQILSHLRLRKLERLTWNERSFTCLILYTVTP